MEEQFEKELLAFIEESSKKGITVSVNFHEVGPCRGSRDNDDLKNSFAYQARNGYGVIVNLLQEDTVVEYNKALEQAKDLVEKVFKKREWGMQNPDLFGRLQAKLGYYN